MPHPIRLHILAGKIGLGGEAEAHRQGSDYKRHRQQQDTIAHIGEIGVLHGLGGQKDEDHNKDQAMDRVVHVLQSGSLDQHEAENRQNRREYDEQGHKRADGAMLKFKDVPLEQPFEFVILKAMPIEDPGKGLLPVVLHGLDTVIHGEFGVVTESL